MKKPSASLTTSLASPTAISKLTSMKANFTTEVVSGRVKLSNPNVPVRVVLKPPLVKAKEAVPLPRKKFSSSSAV